MDYEFKDPLALARIVQLALILWLVVDVCNAGASAYSIAVIQAYQAGSADMSDLQRVDSVSQAAGIATIIINLSTIVLVGRWIYRVNKNAHSLSDDMEMTPGWNIGWFFIPIASLWKPFEGVRQSWRASVSPWNAAEAQVPAWITLWWVCWIISNILNNFIFRMSLDAKTLEDHVTVNWLELIDTPFDLIAGAALLHLVGRLSQIQHDATDTVAQQAIFE